MVNQSKPKNRECLKGSFPREPSREKGECLESRLQQGCREGKISFRGKSYRLHETLSEEKHVHRKKSLAGEILSFAQKRGFEGFKVAVFREQCDKRYALSEIKSVMNRLHGENKLVLLNNGRYLASEAMDEIRDRVKRAIEEEGDLTLEAGKNILGYGRTGTVPVLEYLDSIGFTERWNDVRVLKSQESFPETSPCQR